MKTSVTVVSPKSWSGMLILLTICGSYAISIFQTFSSATISMNLLTDLHLSAEQLGLLGSASIYSYAISQPVTGVLLDRFGSKKVLMLSLLGGALGAIAYSLSYNFLSAFIFRSFSGFFVGMIFSAGVLALNTSFDSHHFTKLSSLFMASSGLGLFIASKGLSVLSTSVGWRGAFVGIGLISMLWFFLAAKSLPTQKIDKIKTATKVSAQAKSKTLLLILFTPQFILLFLYYSCSDAFYASFTSLWAGPFLSQVYNFGDLARGSILSWATLCFTFGAFVISFLYERFLKTDKNLLIALAALNILIALVLFLFTSSLPQFILTLVVMLAPIGAQAAGLICVMGLKLFPAHLAGRVIGCLNLFPILTGALLQSIIGLMVSRGENSGLAFSQIYSSVFGLMLILMCFSLALALLFHGRPSQHNFDAD